MPRTRSLRWYVLSLGVSVEGGLVLLALLLGWLFGQPLWDGLRVSLLDLALGLAAMAPLVGLLLATAHWNVGPLTRIRDLLDDFLLPLFNHLTVFDLVLICLLAGVGEELLFRGLLQNLGCRWLPEAAAVLVASVLFGLAHMVTATYAALTIAVGLYLGAVYIATGHNLFVVAVAHGVYDFIALLYLLSDWRRRFPERAATGGIDWPPAGCSATPEQEPDPATDEL